MKREVRFLSGAGHEIRLATNDKGEKTIAGRAIPYNALSGDMGDWREKIAPGAFARCLNENPDLLLLTEHNVARGILARTSAGTMTVNSDENGLNFEASLPATTLGNDTAISLSRGDLRAMSFAFSCDSDSWDKASDGTYTRTVLGATLYELSVVSCPAYPQSTAALRSLQFPDGAPALPVETRDADAGCQCTCAQCAAAACDLCSNDDCADSECRCQDQRSNRLLAACIARRLH